MLLRYAATATVTAPPESNGARRFAVCPLPRHAPRKQNQVPVCMGPCQIPAFLPLTVSITRAWLAAQCRCANGLFRAYRYGRAFFPRLFRLSRCLYTARICSAGAERYTTDPGCGEPCVRRKTNVGSLFRCLILPVYCSHRLAANSGAAKAGPCCSREKKRAGCNACTSAAGEIFRRPRCARVLSGATSNPLEPLAFGVNSSIGAHVLRPWSSSISR